MSELAPLVVDNGTGYVKVRAQTERRR